MSSKKILSTSTSSKRTVGSSEDSSTRTLEKPNQTSNKCNVEALSPADKFLANELTKIINTMPYFKITPMSAIKNWPDYLKRRLRIMR